MTFFYDLNKKLDGIREKPETTHKQLNERDMGKHNNATTGFAALAKKAGGGEKGNKIAGAQFQKMKKAGQLEEEGMSRAAKGYEKYGKEGMEALAKAGRDGKALDPVRKKYDKYDNKEVGEAIEKQSPRKSEIPAVMRRGNKVTMQDLEKERTASPTSREGMAARQQKLGMKKSVTDEAAKYRDPKYKDKLYTVEPLDYTYGPDADELYYNPKPDDYEGRKRKIGGGEFSHNDPLRKGFGRGDASNSINTHGKRKGMPSRDQITSLKGSIRDAHGTHAEPNLPEAGAPMTAKQKSFAKLAPPADKITFADKIAGAKKEVDEMLGQVAAEAMRNAVGGGRGRNAAMDEGQDDDDDVYAYHDDKKIKSHKTASGGTVTRHGGVTRHQAAPGHYGGYDPDTHPDKDDSTPSTSADGEKRGRGRPRGTKAAIGAKGPSGRSKLMTRENDQDPADQGEYDQEGEMAKDSIKTVVRHAQALEKILGDNDNLPEWVQAKLAKIEGMMTAVDDYMQNQSGEEGEEQELDEKAVSKKQQRFMGMVHSAQKGEKPASKAVGKVAKTMKKSDAEDFAKTKHKGLPEKAAKKNKEEEVEESSTTAGSVATSTATTSSKGSMIGKGIYDSMNRELEKMIAESMNINMSDSTEGDKSLTVTATDDDAIKLAVMLKSAGLGGQGRELQSDGHEHGEEPCDTCGMADCGCGDVHEAVDENSPDYPTNTETAEDNFGYAGGLNKQKASGMATVPVTDVQVDGEDKFATPAHEDALRRMMEMAGLAEGNMPMVKKDGKMVPAFAADGKGKNDLEAKDKEEDTVEESIRRMMEIAGIKKKPMDEEKTDEGNLLTKGLADDDIKIGDKIPGTNVIKKKDIDESIFALTNQWRAYKG
jgi:hypothetical protein